MQRSRMVMVLFVVLAACSKQRDPAPSKPAPSAPPADAATVATPAPEEPSCLVVTVTPTNVNYKAGDKRGELLRASDKLDLEPLRGLVDCNAAEVRGEGSITYQDVIHVMDALIAVGYIDVGLGDDSIPTTPSRPPHPQSEVDWQVGSNGDLVGTIDPATQQKSPLSNAPVIVLTRTEALVGGTVIGKPDDAALAAAIEKALPKPTDAHGTVIVQADASLPYSIIVSAVAAARRSGYYNVMFAVKKK